MNRFLPALALLALTACGRDLEAQVLVPEDVEITWDASYNRADDGIGALVPVDIMVYESATGEPMDFVALEVRAADSGVWVLLPDDLIPAADEDPWLWDVRQDLAFEEVEADEGPVHLRTDLDGLARVDVFVDAFPTDDEGEFLPVHVQITTELGDDAFALVPR